MATRWCPQCRSEYRDGITTCPGCRVPLVDALPRVEREPRHHTAPLQPDEPFLPGDDVVELAQLSTVEAELIAAQLRTGGIPATVFGATVGGTVYTGARRGRVMVRRSDLQEATEFLAAWATGARATDDPFSDIELAARADAATAGTDPETGVL